MRRWIAIISAITMALVGALWGSVTLADSPGPAEGPSKYQVKVAVNPRFPVVGQEATLTLHISHDGEPQGGLPVTLALVHVEAEGHHGEGESHDAAKEGSGMGGMAEKQEAEAPKATESGGMGGMAAKQETEAPKATESGGMEGMAEKQEANTPKATESGGMKGMGEKQEADAPQAEDSHSESEPVEAASAPSEAGTMPGASSGEQVEQAEEHAKATAQALETAPGVYVAKHTFSEGGKWEVKVEMQGEHVDWTIGVRNAPVAWPFLGGMGAVVVGTAAMVAAVKTTKKEW